MNLSIGIVGLPNVGKSTLFNALLKQNLALVANYPFATIEPNVGIASIPDERLLPLAQLVKTNTIKPATIEFVDIAGLVRGASQGEGLGNKFLSHIKSTAAIAHVLRVFTNPDIIRDNPLDPLADLATIRLELQLSDLDIINRQQPKKGKLSTADLAYFDLLAQFKTILNQGQNLIHFFHDLSISQDPQKLNLLTQAQTIAQNLNLITSKPEIFVLNVDEEQLKQSNSLITTWQKKLNCQPHQIVIVSAKIEAELATLDPEEQALFLTELGIDESGLARLAQVAYRTLDLQSFLTAGELEVRAWTIKKGTLAPQAAGVIHTDFIKKFIKAKVVSYPDFMRLGGWKAASEAGKIRFEGKDYCLQPDDLVEFMIGS